MTKATLCQTNHSEVNALQVFDNHFVALSTKRDGIKIFSHKNCEIKSTLPQLKELFNTTPVTIAFSPNGEFLALCSQNALSIIHMPSQLLIRTIPLENQKIELLSFDLESKYLLGATASGRILQYKYDGSSLLSRLYSFHQQASKESSEQSFISCFAFHKSRVACGNNNGVIVIIDLYSKVVKSEIQNGKVRINTLSFIDENTVISGSLDGKLYINNLENQNALRQIDTGFTTLSTILKMPHSNYIMASGDASYVSIYDIKKCKIVHNKYREFNYDIQQIALINDDTLITVLENGDIYRAELPTPHKLKLLVNSNALEKAFHLCENDFMLRDTKEYKELHHKYEKLYNQAVVALIKEQKKDAIALMDIFKTLPSKKSEIAMLFKAYENYPKLQVLFIQKKFSLAYALCTQFPPLEHTFEYKKMEESWRETFMNAQKQILLTHNEEARLLLNEYITVISKRPIIKLMLNHNHQFIEFLKAIESKNFQKVEEIAKIHETFTQIPTYKSLEYELQMSLKDIKHHIHKAELESAKEQLAKLHQLPAISNQVTQLMQEIQSMQTLQNAYNINDFILCYEILDRHKGLESSELGLLLEKHWAKLMIRSEEHALKGNIKDLKMTLGELIRLETRREKLGDLLRVTFHTKIKMLLEKRNLRGAENIIYSYIDIFGIDTEINSLMRFYETLSKVKLAISLNSRQARDNWIHSEIILDV